MRVLVTGASGFIGRHTLAPLRARGFEVHAVSRHLPPDTDDIVWHQVDLLDRASVEFVLATVRPSHLLHLAWYAQPGSFWQAEENFLWLESSLFLLRQFAANGGRRMVMAGTCAEYDCHHGYCNEHLTPRSPATPYGACKHALHEAMRAYGKLHDISSAWGHVFYLYGPGEHPARLVPSVIASLHNKEMARCTHGRQIRDYLHVEDAAEAFVALLDSGVEGAVNIASGQPIALKELVTMIAELSGAPGCVQFDAIPAPSDEPPLIVGECRRLTDEVNWLPTYDLHTGMAQTIRWWQEQRKDERP